MESHSLPEWSHALADYDGTSMTSCQAKRLIGQLYCTIEDQTERVTLSIYLFHHIECRQLCHPTSSTPCLMSNVENRGE